MRVERFGKWSENRVARVGGEVVRGSVRETGVLQAEGMRSEGEWRTCGFSSGEFTADRKGRNS
jgi:hypothetical protein